MFPNQGAIPTSPSSLASLTSSSEQPLEFEPLEQLQNPKRDPFLQQPNRCRPNWGPKSLEKCDIKERMEYERECVQVHLRCRRRHHRRRRRPRCRCHPPWRPRRWERRPPAKTLIMLPQCRNEQRYFEVKGQCESTDLSLSLLLFLQLLLLLLLFLLGGEELLFFAVDYRAGHLRSRGSLAVRTMALDKENVDLYAGMLSGLIIWARTNKPADPEMTIHILYIGLGIRFIHVTRYNIC